MENAHAHQATDNKPEGEMQFFFQIISNDNIPWILAFMLIMT